VRDGVVTHPRRMHCGEIILLIMFIGDKQIDE